MVVGCIVNANVRLAVPAASFSSSSASSSPQVKGTSIRVPINNVSMLDLNVTFKEPVTKEAALAFLEEKAKYPDVVHVSRRVCVSKLRSNCTMVLLLLSCACARTPLLLPGCPFGLPWPGAAFSRLCAPCSFPAVAGVSLEWVGASGGALPYSALCLTRPRMRPHRCTGKRPCRRTSSGLRTPPSWTTTRPSSSRTGRSSFASGTTTSGPTRPRWSTWHAPWTRCVSKRRSAIATTERRHIPLKEQEQSWPLNRRRSALSQPMPPPPRQTALNSPSPPPLPLPPPPPPYSSSNFLLLLLLVRPVVLLLLLFLLLLLLLLLLRALPLS